MRPLSKLLITGSSGYVAHFLAAYFCEKGIQVIGIDITPHKVITEMKNFTFRHCDIRNKEKVVEIVAHEQPTHILHLAYIMDPQHDRKLEYDVDVIGSQNILEAAHKTASIGQLILFSSISVYGGHPDNREPLSEESVLRPHDYTYAVHKKEVERMYRRFDPKDDLKIVILRMATAVGPSYYKPGSIVSSFTKAPFAVSLSGINTKIAFIHEQDVCALTEKVVRDSEIEGIFNLSSDTVTIRELAASQNKRVIKIPLWFLQAIAWFIWKLRLAAFIPAMARLMAYSIVPDGTKLHKRYNYQCKYSAKEAFANTVEERRKLGRL